MLTIQSYILLRKLVKAQGTESGDITIDTFCSSVYSDRTPTKQYSLDKYRTSLTSVLDHLENQGYIKKLYAELDNGIVYRVQHTGFHTFQCTALAVVKFLSKSVIVPIAVSIITTIVISIITA